ncbi:MAG: DUF493 domain-containing protein [Oleiphilaceae bacterium]|nr:DUF493 domain-containing protein [Oleiphilaceae bacterium]
MSEQQPPLVEFPCDYPVRVIGDATPQLESVVTALVQKHDPDFQPGTLTSQPSRNGRFCSLRLTLRATGEDQLKALFAELKASGLVHMVL